MGESVVMKMRKATEDDGELLVELIKENQSLPTSYEGAPMTEEEISSKIVDVLWKQDSNLVHMFYEDGKFMAACFHEAQSKSVVNVHLHVHKDFRGKGKASKILMIDAIACNILNLKILSLVPENNLALIKAMSNAGYRECGVVPNCWNHDGKLISRVVLFKE